LFVVVYVATSTGGTDPLQFSSKVYLNFDLPKGTSFLDHVRDRINFLLSPTRKKALTKKFQEAYDNERNDWSYGYSCTGTQIGILYVMDNKNKIGEEKDKEREDAFKEFCNSFARQDATYAFRLWDDTRNPKYFDSN